MAVLWFPCGVLISLSFVFLLAFLLLPFCFRLVCLRLSCCFPLDFLLVSPWFAYCFPVIFLGRSICFPFDFRWLSFDFALLSVSVRSVSRVTSCGLLVARTLSLGHTGDHFQLHVL